MGRKARAGSTPVGGTLCSSGEVVDTPGSGPGGPKGPCGFESRLEHFTGSVGLWDGEPEEEAKAKGVRVPKTPPCDYGEMAYAPDLGSGGSHREGSSPSSRTIGQVRKYPTV